MRLKPFSKVPIDMSIIQILLRHVHHSNIRSIIGGGGGGYIFIYSCYAQLISFEIEIKILK